MKKDLYKLLGIQSNACAADIRKAYLANAKKFHPDVNTASNASVQFKSIGEAYEILSCPSKRAAYDLRFERDSFASSSSRQNMHDFSKSTYKGYSTTSSHSSFSPWQPRLLSIALGATFLGFALYSTSMGDTFIRSSDDKVLAWFNPNSNRWETPSPWDPVYKSMMHNGESKKMVDRHIVHQTLPPLRSS